MGAIGEAIAPYYIYLKFVHLAAVMAWAFSTSHAFVFYLVPIFRQWRKTPGNVDVIKMRNWAMERFDEGAIIEHVAFPIVIITGLLMLATGVWSVDAGWLVLKLAIVTTIMIPIEIADYYLSHFGGNKAGLRLKGRHARYESMIRVHWLFFLITTPVITVFVSAIVFLAVVKPF
jgi:uncharacterized membrane protein